MEVPPIAHDRVSLIKDEREGMTESEQDQKMDKYRCVS
jgi:hypothetical protein